MFSNPLKMIKLSLTAASLSTAEGEFQDAKDTLGVVSSTAASNSLTEIANEANEIIELLEKNNTGEAKKRITVLLGKIHQMGGEEQKVEHEAISRLRELSKETYLKKTLEKLISSSECLKNGNTTDAFTHASEALDLLVDAQDTSLSRRAHLLVNLIKMNQTSMAFDQIRELIKELSNLAKEEIDDVKKNKPHWHIRKEIPCPFCSKQVPTGAITCPFCDKNLEIQCPHCKRIHPTGSKFCPNTGLQLTQPHLHFEKEIKCPHCKKNIPEKSTVCPFCGQSPIIRCQHCGGYHPLSSKFCGNTGKRMD